MSACYRCGAPHEPQKPHRADFDNEVDFLLASLEWLDFEHPERQEQRAAAWRRLDAAADPERLRRRILDLMMLDRPFTETEDAEFGRLVSAWHVHRRALHPTPDTTTEGTER